MRRDVPKAAAPRALAATKEAPPRWVRPTRAPHPAPRRPSPGAPGSSHAVRWDVRRAVVCAAIWRQRQQRSRRQRQQRSRRRKRRKRRWQQRRRRMQRMRRRWQLQRQRQRLRLQLVPPPPSRPTQSRQPRWRRRERLRRWARRTRQSWWMRSTRKALAETNGSSCSCCPTNRGREEECRHLRARDREREAGVLMNARVHLKKNGNARPNVILLVPPRMSYVRVLSPRRSHARDVFYRHTTFWFGEEMRSTASSSSIRSEPAGRLVHRKLVQRAAVEATHELKVQRALSWAGRDAHNTEFCVVGLGCGQGMAYRAVLQNASRATGMLCAASPG